MIKRTTTSYLRPVYIMHIQCQNYYVLDLSLYVLVKVPYNVLYMTVRIFGVFLAM